MDGLATPMLITKPPHPTTTTAVLVSVYISITEPLPAKPQLPTLEK
jgi:hypothetical protein